MDDVSENAGVSSGFTGYNPWQVDSPHDLVLGELTHANRPPDGSTVDLRLVERVVAEMLAAPYDEHVQNRGCWTLCAFVAHYKGSVNVLHAGGVEAVVCAMRDHPGNVAIHEEALEMLVGVPTDFYANGTKADLARRLCDGRDGIQTILHSIHMHTENLSILQFGVQAIQVIMSHHTAAISLIECGAIRVVVDTMNTALQRVHGDAVPLRGERRMIVRGCIAVLSRWTSEKRATRVLLWEHETVVPVVLAMMATKPDDKWGVLRDGCTILGWLAKGDRYIANDIALHGGVQAVARAGLSIPLWDDLFEWTLGALAANEACMCAIVACGGLRTVIARLQMWHTRNLRGDLLRITKGCGIVANVASTPGGLDAVIEEGGVELMLGIIQGCVQHGTCEESGETGDACTVLKNHVYFSTCRVLEKLAGHDEANMRIIETGGVSILQEVLENSQENAELARLVSGVLRVVHDTRAGFAV
ncbi:hypothetical protein T484DRAFT_1755040 [Baffinella frigidus]|nr:hypothetical protein T484DRAFT_1755040 [Cryptophyta sp. CCMP2293]